jgi:hypothetical protein
MDNLEAFRVDLTALINRHSLESRSDTPDFILADYLTNCLIAYETATRATDEWHVGPEGVARDLELDEKTPTTEPTDKP